MNKNTTKSALIVGGGSMGTALASKISEFYPGKEIIIADCQIPTGIIQNKNYKYIQIDLAKDSLSCLKNLSIDTLIITAGIGRLSYFDTFSPEEIDKNFLINTMPTLKLIHYYYDQINSNKDFFTAVFSSIAGIIASPLYSIYSASKAAQVKFIEAINAELAYHGRSNRILNIAPGYIAGTQFHNESASKEDLEYQDFLCTDIIKRMQNHNELLIPKEETYLNVIQRYQTNAIEFAQSSIQYKLEKNQLNNTPSIKVGYLTGTFDLFHIGHLNLLRNAKKYCDKLIVGVHPDAKHKNKEVFIPLDERMDILRNISFVDDVIVCGSEDTDAYQDLHYDYLFVGTDYKGAERFNRYEEFFADKGVKIIYLPYTQKTSSTKLRAALDKKIDSH